MAVCFRFAAVCLDEIEDHSAGLVATFSCAMWSALLTCRANFVLVGLIALD